MMKLNWEGAEKIGAFIGGCPYIKELKLELHDINWVVKNLF